MIKEHLEDANMTYFEHLRFSWSIAFALLVHGLIPRFFTTYASDKLKTRINDQNN